MKKYYIIIFAVCIFSLPVIAASNFIIKEIPSPGPCLTGLAFDGTSLWGVDRKKDMIYKIDPATGKIQTHFTCPGYFATGMTWGKEHLWITDLDFTNTSTETYVGKIYKVSPKTGKTVQVILTPGSDPQGVTWCDNSLWISDNQTDMIYQISPDDGTTIHSFPAPAGDPRGLAWDGSYLWIADRANDELYRVHPSKGIVVMTLNSPGPYPWGLTWMKNTLIIGDYQTDKIYTLNILDLPKIKKSNPRREEIEFNSEIINFGPGVLTTLNIFMAEPEDKPNQQILDITYPIAPEEFVTDQWGQKSAHFIKKNMNPGDRFNPTLKVRAEINEVMYYIFPEKVDDLNDIPQDLRMYLADDIKYCITMPYIQKAAQIAIDGATNPYWMARNIFDYLRQILHYERIGGWDIAPTVISRGSGSCSEYAFAYIALCRAAGLPARYVGAVVIRGEEACFDFVYHRWVEVYLPGYGWIPVDPSRGDKDLPADQAKSFGYLNNVFLITTQGGGDSEYLGWDYNSHDQWEAEGPVQLRVENIAEWNPVKAD